MTTARVVHYRELSAEYLRQARLHLAEGDLTQASERGWGQRRRQLKAVAEARGSTHNGHFLLRRIVRQLVEESGDDLEEALRSGGGSADQLL